METPNETPLEALLPAEVVAKIRELVAQVLSEQPVPRAPILEGNVYRPMPTAFSQSSASVTPRRIYRPMPAAFAESSASVDPQYFLQELLKDPATLKKIWASPDGVMAIVAIIQIILQLHTNQLVGLQGRQSEGFQKAMIEQGEQQLEQSKQQSEVLQQLLKERVEKFPATPKDQSETTPKPTPDEVDPPLPPFSLRSGH